MGAETHYNTPAWLSTREMRFVKKYIFNFAVILAVVALALPSHQAMAKRAIACSDGTTSTASGRGACSGHGGVMKKAKTARVAKVGKAAKVEKTAKVAKVGKAAKVEKTAKAAKVEAPAKAAAAGATAKCKDGTYSHAKNHRGACSKHGGVAEWLAK